MTDFELDRIVRLEGTDYDRRRKLTTSDVTRIKKAYKEGSYIIDLANEYNVSYGTILYHVSPFHKNKINKNRKKYAQSFFDHNAQRKSRVAHKRAIVAGLI